MQLRLNSLTYHHEIWYGGIFLQRPKEQHTVNVHGLFISLQFQDGSCSIILFSNTYVQAKWMILSKCWTLMEDKLTFPTFENSENFQQSMLHWEILCEHHRANDHRTTLKLSKLLIYWCFFLWHLYDLILQQFKQTLFIHNSENN